MVSQALQDSYLHFKSLSSSSNMLRRFWVSTHVTKSLKLVTHILPTWFHSSKLILASPSPQLSFKLQLFRKQSLELQSPMHVWILLLFLIPSVESLQIFSMTSLNNCMCDPGLVATDLLL